MNAHITEKLPETRRAEEEEAMGTSPPTGRRSRIPLPLRRIAPYLGAVGALALVVMVLLTMYFTLLEWQWVTFLSGILGAAVLSLASRSIHAERTIARRNAQLALARQRLGKESALRKSAEQTLASMEQDTVHLQDALPVMLVAIDTNCRVTYHNPAFRHGLCGPVGRIDGRHISEVVDGPAFEDMVDHLSSALEGKLIHREQLHRSAAGNFFRLLTQYLPRFDESGAIAGAFLMMTDVTDPSEIPQHGKVDAAAGDAVAPTELPIDTVHDACEPDSDDGGAQLRSALEHDEFCLFFQSIEPLAAGRTAVPFREVLLRLKAEEDGMLPPGSFQQVAESQGMLPELDKWVVRRLLQVIGEDARRQQAMYSVNLSAQTMMDPLFPAYVASTLRDNGLPGSLLCFEVQETEILERLPEASRCIDELKSHGCRFAICGFSGNRTSMDLLRRIPAHYLKIDGGLILKIRRSALDYARVKAIERVAHAIGIRTIAECVEDTRTLEHLGSLGVDYVQGFVVSHPRDLQQLFNELECTPASKSPQFVAAIATAA